MYIHLKNLIEFFIEPFVEFIKDLSIQDTTISFGFGSVKWFEFTLIDLVSLILGFIVLIIFYKLIYALLKAFLSLFFRGWSK